MPSVLLGQLLGQSLANNPAAATINSLGAPVQSSRELLGQTGGYHSFVHWRNVLGSAQDGVSDCNHFDDYLAFGCNPGRCLRSRGDSRLAVRHDPVEYSPTLTGLSAARDFFLGCFAKCDPRRETLWVAHVDHRAYCLHLSRHDGGESGTEFPLRDIVADAAIHRSAGIILAHNHPSGDPMPSDSDYRVTRRLASAAEALDCTLLDHLVIAGEKCISFRKLGLL